ncbi:Lrp/AsnC family transcriptional regulator [Roseospira goensis]|uniref:DNA-binding Lrp family transcriptional regulator n=1 Tax=Roseospira goensis TaxID=391922 RepID=A0A7W6WLG6_9PROT|nr:Lrp/AsnC family transcriptional regulator [Roseospira goensis]MBB4287401.1 DNA-binding Lrp family transcriptional regulator [Roseospira goensis]
MSRRPCHEEAALRVHVRRGHQGIWEAIRARQRDAAWSVRDIWRETGIQAPESVRDYVRRLERAGYVERAGHVAREDDRTGRAQAALYRLVRDAGPEAPRLRRDGTESPPTAQEAMWRTLRMIGRDGVTADDLVVMASTEAVPVTRGTAASYLRHLCRAGYLRVVEDGKPGHRPGTGRPARYALRAGRNTGPRAPMIVRLSHAVWDPNTGQFAGHVEADVSGGGRG